MDKIDEKLIREIDINPRISLTRLGKKLRISQQQVDYRLKRFLTEKTITKFGTIINLKALGKKHYRIFFNFNSNKYSNQELFNYLKKQKGVYWASRIGGKYDLHLVLFVDNFEEFECFIDEFNKAFPDLIKEYQASYVLDYLIFRHKYLESFSETLRYGYNDKFQEIDDLDKKILNDIKDNCRLSALEISKNKKVSYKTIINRIKSLEKRKIILGYRIFLKSSTKNPFIILFSFKEYSKEIEKGLIKELECEKLVTQVLKLFGTWQLYLHLRAENMEKIQELIINLRNKYKIINEYEIIPIFEDISINLYPT